VTMVQGICGEHSWSHNDDNTIRMLSFYDTASTLLMANNQVIREWNLRQSGCIDGPARFRQSVPIDGPARFRQSVCIDGPARSNNFVCFWYHSNPRMKCVTVSKELAVLMEILWVQQWSGH